MAAVVTGAVGAMLATAVLPSAAAAKPLDGEQHTLEQALLAAVQHAHFDEALDFGPVEGICPGTASCPPSAGKVHFAPNVDVAVIALDEDGHPTAAANVLLSRDHPGGVIVPIDTKAGPAGSYGVSSVRWRKWDITRWDGAAYDQDTGAVLPGTAKGWADNPPLTGSDDLVSGRDKAGLSFMSPYPASLFKLIVAFRIMRLVDAKAVTLSDPLPADPTTTTTAPTTTAPTTTTTAPPSDNSGTSTTSSTSTTSTTGRQTSTGSTPAGGELKPSAVNRTARTDESRTTTHTGRSGLDPSIKTVRDAMFAMMTYSDNESAKALLRLLSNRNDLGAMQAELQGLGLGTLQITGTNPQTGGNWQPGQISMTSMDTARLLWLIDGGDGKLWTKPDGTAVSAALLSDDSRAYLRGLLEDQAYNEALSTTMYCGAKNIQPGIPALQPTRWIGTDGTVSVDGYVYGRDVRPCNKAAEVTFGHKTGVTYNYAADAGIVLALPGQDGRHYVISFISNLGYRYPDAAFAKAAANPCDAEVMPICYTRRIPMLGKAIDDALRRKGDHA